jgi:acyl carrier protein
MKDFSGWLFNWFAQHAPQVRLGVDDNYFEAGAIDSFGVIELIEDVEQAFEVRFSQDDFQDRRLPTILGLAAILAEKTGA